MTQEEIKSELEYRYTILRVNEERIKYLRGVCKHPNTHEGNWSWRIGCIEPAIICSDCGSFIKYTEGSSFNMQSVQTFSNPDDLTPLNESYKSNEFNEQEVLRIIKH